MQVNTKLIFHTFIPKIFNQMMLNPVALFCFSTIIYFNFSFLKKSQVMVTDKYFT